MCKKHPLFPPANGARSSNGPHKDRIQHHRTFISTKNTVTNAIFM